MTHAQILEELPEMWAKIDADGILEGTDITFRYFMWIAHKKQQQAQVKEMIRNIREGNF